MKKIFSFFGLFFLLSFTVSTQVICLEFEDPAQHGGNILPDELQFLIGQTIEISTLSIYFQEELFSTFVANNQPFSGKSLLIDRYSEFYNFSIFSDSIYGNISTFNFWKSKPILNNKKIELIKINDQGTETYFVHFDEFLFKMNECQNYEPCYGEGLRIKEYNTDSIAFTIKQVRYKSEIIPAEFKIYTEQVLCGPEATIIEITPAELETRFLTLPGNQINTCPDIVAVYDTIYRDFIVAETYEELSLIPKVEVSVSEMVLAKEGYNKVIDFVPHEYLFHDSCVVVSETIGKWNNLSLKINCSNQIFLPCIHYESKDTQFDKGIFKIEKTKACPTGYETRPSGCYKIDFIGNEYVPRSYQKLIKPASTKSTIIPAEHIKHPVQIIKNIDEIPAHCITTDSIKWSYLKNVKNATSKHIHDKNHVFLPQIISFLKKETPLTIIEKIEEEAESIHLDASNKIYCKSNDLVSVELVCEKFISDALIDKIIETLRGLGYKIPLENNEQEYLKALTHFQKENNLVIGVLSLETLETLGLSY